MRFAARDGRKPDGQGEANEEELNSGNSVVYAIPRLRRDNRLCVGIWYFDLLLKPSPVQAGIRCPDDTAYFIEHLLTTRSVFGVVARSRVRT